MDFVLLEKDDGIHCLVRRHWLSAAPQCIMGDIECPKEGTALPGVRTALTVAFITDANSTQTWVLFTITFVRDLFRHHFLTHQVAPAVGWNPFSYHQLLNASQHSFRRLHSHTAVLGGIICTGFVVSARNKHFHHAAVPFLYRNDIRTPLRGYPFYFLLRSIPKHQRLMVQTFISISSESKLHFR